MKDKRRILTVLNSRSGYPQIMTTGAWLGEMGFEPGDQVTLTNPKQGMLVILDTLPANIWYPQKQKKRLEFRIIRLKKELAEGFWESDIKSAQHELKMAELDLEAVIAIQKKRA
jgi:hypothetical protein